MNRKILFIVNPNAGKKKSEQIIELISKRFPKTISYEIKVWQDKNNFEEIAQKLKTENFTDAIAVGGDGTVNEVAKTIKNTNIVLGIIPMGSGNGLARTLGLSMKHELVLKQIEKCKTETIDSGTVNGIPFFCTSGIGFDAHIGNLFATSKSRGLKTYVKITTAELFKYRAKNYIVQLNGQEILTKAFLITVANAGQYGNDFYIAPEAKLQDGFFHVVILKPFAPLKVFSLLQKILNKKANESAQILTYVTNKVTIVRESNDPIHFDGEPSMQPTQVNFEMFPKSLKVIVGEKF